MLYSNPSLSAFALILLTILPNAALAQSQGDEEVNEPIVMYHLRRAIVVTANGREQYPQRIGQAVSLINSSDIALTQFRTIADLLATTPGVTVSRNGGPGQPAAVRIRGAEDSQTLTLIDGIRVNDPSSPGGAFDFGTLLSGNIDRIEVLRGPNSVPWGSQAIGGIVNIVTAPVTGANLRAEYGYKNAKHIVGQAGGFFGPVTASLGGGYFSDDGISAYKNGTERDGFRQYAANGRVGVEISNTISIDLRGYYANSRVDFDGFPPPFFAFADTTEFAKTQQLFGYAGINADLLGIKNRLGFTFSDTARDSVSGPNLAPDFIARGRTVRFEYQGDTGITDDIRAVFGVDHETSRFRDEFSRYATGLTSGYVQAIVTPIDSLTLTGGIRIDDHRAYGTTATLSANSAWRIGLDTILRASYGEGFKAPTLFQLFSDFGNSALRPETAQSFDLGIEQNLAGDAVTVSLTAFHRDTTNQIDFSFAQRANRPFGFYDNIARTRAEGVEFTVSARPVQSLSIGANYSLIDAKNHATGLTLLRRPKHSANFSVDWEMSEKIKLGGSVQHVGSSRDVDFVTFAPTTLTAYTLASLRASVAIGETFELYGRVENLFDERYETVSGYGTLGRNAHIGVRAKF